MRSLRRILQPLHKFLLSPLQTLLMSKTTCKTQHFTSKETVKGEIKDKTTNKLNATEEKGRKVMLISFNDNNNLQ